MIINVKRHTGSDWLAGHLVRTDVNEWVQISAPALLADDIQSAFTELQELAFDAKTKKPFVHAIMNPSIKYSDEQWQNSWYEFEKEFAIVGQPYVSARHMKRGAGGRDVAHEHRVYLWLDLEGRVVRDNYCAVRAQKVARICEFQAGEPMVSGTHNRVVRDWLCSSGYSDVANQMQRLGLLERRRPEAVSANDRQKTERANDIAADEVGRIAFEIWKSVQTGSDFAEKLKGQGLRLCMGSKVIGLMTERGVFHDLRRMMSLVARSRDAKAPKKADIVTMTKDLILPPHTALEATLKAPKNAEIGTATITGQTRHDLASKTHQIITDNHAVEMPEIHKAEFVETPPMVPIVPNAQIAAAELDENARQVLIKAFDAGMVEIGQSALETLSEPDSEVDKYPYVHAPYYEELTEAEILERNEFGHRAMTEGMERVRNTPSMWLTHEDRKAVFKAKLANIDAKYGADIKFVHQLGDDRKTIELKDKSKVNVSRSYVRAANPTFKSVEIAVAAAASTGLKEIRIKASQHWIYEHAYEVAEELGVTLVSDYWDNWCLERDSVPVEFNPPATPDEEPNQPDDPPAPKFGS